MQHPPSDAGPSVGAVCTLEATNMLYSIFVTPRAGSTHERPELQWIGLWTGDNYG